MTNSRVKFPCPVRRLNVAWRGGRWAIEKETRVESMTLPRSDDLPESAREGGVSGFWYEAVDERGRTIYRQLRTDPFGAGVEVFDEGGKISRRHEPTHDVTLKVLVPDVPEVAALHIYSSTNPSEPESVRRGRPARRVAEISLRGERGGDDGRQ